MKFLFIDVKQMDAIGKEVYMVSDVISTLFQFQVFFDCVIFYTDYHFVRQSSRAKHAKLN